MTTIYTAVGIFHCKGRSGGLTYPVIIAGQKEYGVDLQEMILWTILTQNVLTAEQLEEKYQAKAAEIGCGSHRTCQQGLQRLLQRGLAVSGSGVTDEDALYHLLSCLYIVPISSNPLLRLLTFLKLTLTGRVPFSKAKRILQREPMSDCEKKVVRLSSQSLLSTAEIIKCVEQGVHDLSSNEKVLDILYGDQETTCDNIASLSRCLDSRQPVILAIVNLYLRQQIFFERGELA